MFPPPVIASNISAGTSTENFADGGGPDMVADGMRPVLSACMNCANTTPAL
jgi:hypothetical protein